MSITLEEALAATRTGDVWVFRGRSFADRAIQFTTNSPVNHVGMALVVDDLPPMLWHAELGRGLPSTWTGRRERGAQLHDLHDAVRQWTDRYRQQAWLRQIDPEVSRAQEDAALRAVARIHGTAFPSHAQLAWRWIRGRLPTPRLRRGGAAPPAGQQLGQSVAPTEPGPGTLASAYCAEIVALTFEEMGLLRPRRRGASWYDPGRFWSGDRLILADGHRLGAEIAVRVPPRGD